MVGKTGAGETRDRARAGGESRPFVLSKALPVVPARLTRKITNSDFVDMAELLSDNVEAERRRLATSKGALQGSTIHMYMEVLWC